MSRSFGLPVLAISASVMDAEGNNGLPLSYSTNLCDRTLGCLRGACAGQELDERVELVFG